MSEGGDWAGGVVARRDLLDRPERLRGPFWSSLALHIGIVSSIVGLTWVQNHQPHNVFGPFCRHGYQPWERRRHQYL